MATHEAVVEEAEARAAGDDRVLFELHEQHLPHATIRIEATEERWVEHVRRGMFWDVYVFDDGAGLLL